MLADYQTRNTSPLVRSENLAGWPPDLPEGDPMLSFPATRFAALFALSCLVTLPLVSRPASAELIVLQSSAPGLKAGQVLADSASLDIPAGKSAVFVLPNGATRTVNGPHKGGVGDLTKGVSVDRELLGAVKSYVETGGATATRVGATRSARPPTAVAKGFEGWSSLPITASGDHCVAAGAQLELVRTTAGPSLTVSIANLTTSERGRTAFGDGATKAAWPSDVSLANGAKYAIAATDLPMRTIQLRIVKPVPSSDDTLRVLHGQRCITQMKAWLAGAMQR